MIVYHPAFDLYHTVFRIARILSHYKGDAEIEVDRLRIWDFYLLFPNKISAVKLKKTETDIRDYFKRFIPRQENPYELFLDNRKMFERIKPYQLQAIKMLASHGIIDSDSLKSNKILVLSAGHLKKYSENLGELSPREKNTIAILTSHFYLMSLYGPDGLKERTNLLESKYDTK